jgi:lipocalin-like protein
MGSMIATEAAMDRRHLLEIMATAGLGFVIVGSGAVAQQKSIKEQLVGAWTLLLADGIQPDGTHVPAFGPNPVGILIFTSNGRYSLQIMRVVNRAPFASKDRDSGTADENKAVAQGTISHFGTYTVDEAGKAIVLHIEGSSFPNWENTNQQRLVTAITDEVLTYTNPTPPAQGFTHTELAWRKAK